jgi:hypothetical protein
MHISDHFELREEQFLQEGEERSAISGVLGSRGSGL